MTESCGGVSSSRVSSNGSSVADLLLHMGVATHRSLLLHMVVVNNTKFVLSSQGGGCCRQDTKGFR